MIVSASRRTDIPALYATWLVSRIEAGFADVPHPFDPGRVRRVDLRPSPSGEMEALVLWTRDPGPLLPVVPKWEGAGTRTIWLVTITGYPKTLEPGSPQVPRVLASVERLSSIVGPDRIAWRYDPVLLCPQTGVDAAWHRENFRGLAQRLRGLARRCILSFYDDYAKARRRLALAGLSPEGGTPPVALFSDLAAAARAAGIEPQSCCEELEAAGIPPGACIDGDLLEHLWGLGTGRKKDPGQRPGCRCAPAVDIGVYDTCVHGCLYCYATGPGPRARGRHSAHDPGKERLA